MLPVINTERIQTRIHNKRYQRQLLGLFDILNMRKLSRIEEKELTMLVEKYGADQLLQEGITKKKLATLIGAGILAGTSLTDLPRNCNADKEPLRTEYTNPYGIDEMGCINNGNMPLKQLAPLLYKIFGVESKDCYRFYTDIKRRKNESRTYFLDRMQEKLNERMLRDDELDRMRR